MRIHRYLVLALTAVVLRSIVEITYLVECRRQGVEEERIGSIRNSNGLASTRNSRPARSDADRPAWWSSRD